MKQLFTTSAIAVFSLTTAAHAAGLTADTKAAILSALDDEYHAESIYETTMEKHGEVRPFVNIIKAERRHASALIALLEDYGETVPENPYANGQKALEPIPDTLAAACDLGVAAEIENVRLYDEDLLPAVAAYSDITRVMQNLRDASEDKHLPAFQRCSSAGGRQGMDRKKGS